MATDTNGTSTVTCPIEAQKDTPPLFQNGKLVLQKYHVGFIIAGSFAFVASGVSIWLVNKHLRWYTNKPEQRYIVRILFMVPIYALVSFASFVFWNHSTGLILLRDAYESTVLTAFFYLLLLYLDHDPTKQQSIFLRAGLSREADQAALKSKQVRKRWIFPLGFVRWKPQDGLLFLQLMKWGVLQYCTIRPVTTFIAILLNYFGLYCEESWGLGWGHIYITVIVSISVSIAMFCLIQLYVPVAEILAPHRPLMKLFAIKAVVFLTFWQATFLGLLSMAGVVKATDYMTASDVNIGIGALLETFEMMLFAFLHIHAFTYKPYRESSRSTTGPTPRLRSLCHAMDFRETFREIWVGLVYILAKVRRREPALDVHPRRAAHYEEAFGKARIPERILLEKTGPLRKERPTLPSLKVEVEQDIAVDIEGERQWLGLGDNYAYGLGYMRREKSDELEVQIGRELEKRGYRWSDGKSPKPYLETEQNQHRRPPWWRRIYNRISERGSEDEGEPDRRLIYGTERRSGIPSSSKELPRDLPSLEPEIDDPPPRSILRTHHRHLNRQMGHSLRHGPSESVEAPLSEIPDVTISANRWTSDNSRAGPSSYNDHIPTHNAADPEIILPRHSVGGIPGHHVVDVSLDDLTEHPILTRDTTLRHQQHFSTQGSTRL